MSETSPTIWIPYIEKKRERDETCEATLELQTRTRLKRERSIYKHFLSHGGDQLVRSPITDIAKKGIDILFTLFSLCGLIDGNTNGQVEVFSSFVPFITLFVILFNHLYYFLSFCLEKYWIYAKNS